MIEVAYYKLREILAQRYLSKAWCDSQVQPWKAIARAVDAGVIRRVEDRVDETYESNAQTLDELVDAIVALASV